MGPIYVQWCLLIKRGLLQGVCGVFLVARQWWHRAPSGLETLLARHVHIGQVTQFVLYLSALARRQVSLGVHELGRGLQRGQPLGQRRGLGRGERVVVPLRGPLTRGSADRARRVPFERGDAELHGAVRALRVVVALLIARQFGQRGTRLAPHQLGRQGAAECSAAFHRGDDCKRG